MNILINLISIKKGGGQQVASNFVNQIFNEKDVSTIFLVSANTYIHQLLISKEAKIVPVPNRISGRIFFQVCKLRRVIKRNKIDVIYTMFGPGLHARNTLSITGCAYSNLFFPEIDFWSGYSFLQRVKLKLIDRYRLKSTLKSDAIIFENEAMMQRASSLFKFPAEKTVLILPSISEYKLVTAESSHEMTKIKNRDFNIVLLTGWHKNKKIEIVPYILSELNKRNVYDVSFVITVPEDHPNSQKLQEVAQKLKVSDKIVFLNSVAPNNLPLLFKHVNALALFSLLESFSNNIIEAWHFKKPLFISDEEWSRAICKNAAVYVDRNSASDIANKIIIYRSSQEYKIELINEMGKILLDYPSPKQKVLLQLDFIKKIYSERSN